MPLTKPGGIPYPRGPGNLTSQSAPHGVPRRRVPICTKTKRMHVPPHGPLPARRRYLAEIAQPARANPPHDFTHYLYTSFAKFEYHRENSRHRSEMIYPIID
ncbi:unnamed protein product [Lasius platythorax]|uniref:Uncharacterized protein n=1 Tax=Lasius platythorax TaxID=488582 RepID=A0AAV2N8V9_9HYME